MSKTKYRYFYDAGNDCIYEVEQNLCTCHPFDLAIVWGKSIYKSGWFKFKNKKEIKIYLNRWVELK